ncbi:cell division ATP-binding protein FtsE [Candidatus Woesebacteria bacterium RIFCSPHIGHO2_01_FULL_44_10]|uniref:Cell division ATP-binding protein FtsE n=1 Tax=Candidatus Woesebacteria bacterium RIFCSPLOWO2_01_FULL_44_14 TaxID=1802525 RepID=A0A1F8C2H5_9BACT|nr:MAG: cell division ATP-binding protein FtsE [Candidatus Woesebacteria bacterium RIFCSPHIGHO2_01_FULL_44_10]OGM54953.1 MAG: cell division ATP-binding protein FtsE [Candidatus Woesebacteria bacterium RIFCSPHIGHO2_12_FULL_44_11]OGM70340.1 MAG: cell division ATP-binding protein FtsE [Candidatus Woesebacteria bacterium RIFCSPLOWO2_01_FULL_44_14]
MIKFENVSKSFGDIKAIDNVNFEIADGEFVFISGPSGAGKTTLLHLLLGEYHPSAGEVIFDETKVSQIPKKELPFFRRKIGVVFQDYRLLPERTVRENVEVALAVAGVSEEEWVKRADQVLKLVGILDRAQLFPSQLSGGEAQRVSLARALVTNPRVIFADEPTGNLDWETADAIMDLFHEINKEGKTVIIASHHKAIIDKMDKRVIELKKGELVHDSGHGKHKKR